MGILTIKEYVAWCNKHNRKPCSAESVAEYDKARGYIRKVAFKEA